MSDSCQEPIFDVAQLAHVELLTPQPERTLFSGSPKEMAAFYGWATKTLR